jgi:tetratricopeptide (TPR) repeat protein
MGRGDEALAAFEQAVKLEPVFGITHLNLGEALAAADRHEEAIEQYRVAIEKDPSKLRAYKGLAKLLARSGRLAEAIKTLDDALDIAQANGEDKTIRQLRALRDRYSRRQEPETDP